jgi:class 3 adenylate cyclase
MVEPKRSQDWRPPFTVALVGLVVALTALTGLVVGGLAWRENRAISRALVETAMAQTARLTAGQTTRFLKGAESAARLGPELIAQGQLDPSDMPAFERFAIAVLRAHPEFSWVSYGDREDRFVGAWRDAAGHLYLNRSFPWQGRIRLEEDQVLPEGARRPVRRSDDHGYRPRERPHFAAAEQARDLVWTEPYEFYAGGGLGITCAAPILDAGGQVRGVFTVDFSLDRLGGFLGTLDVSPRGRVFLATRQGALLLGREARPGAASERSVDAELVRSTTRHIDPDRESQFEFAHGGDSYLGRAVPLEAGNLRWLVQVVVPERDYTDPIDRQGRRASALGLLALGLALGGGLLTARWIARPLRDLAEQARRIRQGNLEVAIAPGSRDEIGVLARAMADMARALRDRDFIRETLGRYVNPELAAQCLRDRSALSLGGEVRQVAILMSDIRGFSELSERIAPEALIAVVNGYLARMTPIILAHGGTISDFIGDGILAVFGAPIAHGDDVDQAARCARSMQRAMHLVNADNRDLGLPDLAMGIAVHAGPVVAGNIGTPDRVKYGVVGAAVNLASRIQALAAGGEVVVSEAALKRLGPIARVGPARYVRVKGIADPVAVHELIGFVDSSPAGEHTARHPESRAAGMAGASESTGRPGVPLPTAPDPSGTDPARRPR